jgi:hypothetical protein|tara:strand:+ start:32 stop:532 length:501 start_codon:yes stop_codon:yes gene_type:complete
MNKIVLLCLTLFAPVSYERQEVIGFPPDKAGEWKKPPNIKVCDKDIPVEKVSLAVEWWRMRGYKFGYIIRSNCLSKKETGFIYITLPGQTFDFGKNLARTHLARVDNSSVIIWAHIEVSDVHKSRLLEHEIGHALGWTHSSIDKHIMHPSWQRGGWVDKGILREGM